MKRPERIVDWLRLFVKQMALADQELLTGH
jgi:hypothetical protein